MCYFNSSAAIFSFALFRHAHKELLSTAKICCRFSSDFGSLVLVRYLIHGQ